MQTQNYGSIFEVLEVGRVMKLVAYLDALQVVIQLPLKKISLLLRLFTLNFASANFHIMDYRVHQI